MKKIRVKIGEDRNGEAIVKWACGRTIEQFIASIVRIHIDNGLLDDFISPPVVLAVIPVETSNLGKSGRRVRFGEYAQNWLTVYHKQKVAEKTFKTDIGYISKHLIPYFWEEYLHEITVHGFQEFLNSRAQMKNPKGLPLAKKTIGYMMEASKTNL